MSELGVRTPFYRIVVNGKEIPDYVYDKIIRVVFKEPEEGEQYFTISMKDQDYSIQDSGMFIVDKTTCTLYIGYLDDYDSVMDGILQMISPDYPRNDTPTLEITFKNISAIMNREEKNVRYVGKTYSDVVIDIAKRYGLRYDVDDTKHIFDPKPIPTAPSPVVPSELKVGSNVHMKGYLYASSYGEGRGQFRDQDVVISRIVDTSRVAPYLVNGVLGWVKRADITLKDAPAPQSDQQEPTYQDAIYQTGKSDYEFCRAMAKKIGYKFYVDSATVFFKKKIESNVYQLDYRVGKQNLLNFKPNITATNTGNSFKSSNIDFNENNVSNTGTPEPTEPKVAPRYHTVKSGEYLIKISKQYYGDGSRYKEIYNANTDKVKMPGYVIYTGSKLLIP